MLGNNSKTGGLDYLWDSRRGVWTSHDILKGITETTIPGNLDGSGAVTIYKNLDSEWTLPVWNWFPDEIGEQEKVNMLYDVVDNKWYAITRSSAPLTTCWIDFSSSVAPYNIADPVYGTGNPFLDTYLDGPSGFFAYGCGPLAVEFEDESSGCITSRIWSFANTAKLPDPFCPTACSGTTIPGHALYLRTVGGWIAGADGAPSGDTSPGDHCILQRATRYSSSGPAFWCRWHTLFPWQDDDAVLAGWHVLLDLVDGTPVWYATFNVDNWGASSLYVGSGSCTLPITLDVSSVFGGSPISGGKYYVDQVILEEAILPAYTPSCYSTIACDMQQPDGPYPNTAAVDVSGVFYPGLHNVALSALCCNSINRSKLIPFLVRKVPPVPTRIYITKNDWMAGSPSAGSGSLSIYLGDAGPKDGYYRVPPHVYLTQQIEYYDYWETPLSWEWDFGDGSPTVTTTVPESPSHTYLPGVHYASVTTSNECGIGGTTTFGPIVVI